MTENALVSVIVPVYQVEKYLERCIDSILNQSYHNLEILLIDDGSKDKSGVICDAYACRDSRIQVYHKKNGGLSDARNYGIDRAKGEYLAFIDSDDFISYDFIQVLLEISIKYQSDITVCDFERVSGDVLSGLESDGIKVYTKAEALAEICKNTGRHVLMTVAWNKLYKKELFEGIRYPVGKLHEDEATTYRLIDRTDRVVVSEKKMYGYYMSTSSIMRSDYNKRRLDIIGILLDRIRFFHERAQYQLEKEVKNQLSYTLIYHYYNVRKHLKDSETIQEKLLKCFETYCIRDRQCREFPLGTRINNSFFYHFTGCYYRLFCLYQKLK